jgi:hypothetical protein
MASTFITSCRVTYLHRNSVCRQVANRPTVEKNLTKSGIKGPTLQQDHYSSHWYSYQQIFDTKYRLIPDICLHWEYKMATAKPELSQYFNGTPYITWVAG